MSKRIVDVLGAFFGLVVCAPLFVVIAILVKLGSRGPVFFKQIRVGQGFKQFRLYKFRTMEENAPQKGGELTIGEDSRITQGGGFLRQFKLDELPQLFNVLIGDMKMPRRPLFPGLLKSF